MDILLVGIVIEMFFSSYSLNIEKFEIYYFNIWIGSFLLVK